MATKEELTLLYNTLLCKGVIKNKTDMAIQMGRSKHSVQNAFSMGAPYLNDTLIRKIKTHFAEYLEESPKDEDIISIKRAEYNALLRTIRSQQETIATITSMLSRVQ